MLAKLATALALALLAITPASAAVSDGLISGAMPDPATWAMLLAGLGMVGLAGRQKRIIAA